MAHKVTIKYSSPGLQPPVYITTSLSDPQWDLLEMDCGELPGGEREFVKTFHADEGEYQYKFRLGPGDWWVCDEGMPTLDDGLGNRNNVLVVKDGVSAKKTAAHPQCLAEDDDDDAASSELERVPTLPHERDSSERNPKRDSLGDDVVGDKLAQDVKTEASDDHQAPLLPHEQNGTPNRRVGVQPEDVPVDFSADDEDGDVEPSHYPQSPIFAHERDVPARVPTPGTDEDEDYMEEAPLMRHETLSPEPSERHHAPRLAHEKDDHHDAHDSDVLLSPVSPTSSAHFPVSRDHIPAEADPNDPSLERLPTHQEGILESLRRSSMRMSKDEALQDVITSTSPVTKTMSHASSQSPSLPSVLEDEEEPEDEALSHDGSKPAVDSHALPTSSARPAALMTPPRTPDESKLPDVAGHHLSNHHHKAVAERDMLEEATHGVSHHGSDQNKSVDHQTDAVGITEASAASKDTSKPASKPNTQAKSNGFFGGFFQSALGLGLTVLLGAGAAWLAFRMSDTIKDGGATLTS